MVSPRDTAQPVLRGVVTEKDLLLAEASFPGVLEYHRKLREAGCVPETFLDLLRMFGTFGPSAPAARKQVA